MLEATESGMDVVTPPPSPMDKFNEGSPSNKHYSFLSALDSITGLSTELSLDGSLVGSAHEGVKRLSATLHALVGPQQAAKVIGEMPMPTYDNGNVDVVATISPIITHLGFEPDASTQLKKRRPSFPLTPQPSQGDIADFKSKSGAVDTHRPGAPSLLDRNTGKPCSANPGISLSINCDIGPGQIAQRLRTDSVDSNMVSSIGHKKRTTFDDQRYTLPSPQDKCLPGSQLNPKRWPMVITLKDISTKPERKRKISSMPLTPIAPEVMPMLTFKEALKTDKEPLSPLHDESEDRKFVLECKQMFRNPSQCSFIGEPILRTGAKPSKSSLKSQAPLKSRIELPLASPVSINTDILDWPWPEPVAKPISNFRADCMARHDSDTIPQLSTVGTSILSHSASLQSDTTKLSATRNSTFVRKTSAPCLNQKQTRAKVSSKHSADSLTLSTIHQRSVFQPVRDQRQDSEHRDVLSTIPLHLDTQLDEKFGKVLHERAGSSRRSARVSELRRRDISLLSKDLKRSSDSKLLAKCREDAARPPPRCTSALSERRTENGDSAYTQSQIPHAMKERALPPTPPKTQCRTRSSTTGNRSKRAPQEPRLRRISSRQRLDDFGRPQDRNLQTLAQSPVMTLVDTDPDVAHGFRAGAISPAVRMMNAKNLKINVGDDVQSSNNNVETSPSSSVHSRSSYAQSETTELTVPSNSNSLDSTAVDNLPKDFQAHCVAMESKAASEFDQRRPSQCLDSEQGTINSQRPSELELGLPQSDQYVQGNANAYIQALQAEMLRIKRIYDAMTCAQKDGTNLELAPPSFHDLLYQDRQASVPVETPLKAVAKENAKSSHQSPADAETRSGSGRDSAHVKEISSHGGYDWKPKIASKPNTNQHVAGKRHSRIRSDSLQSDGTFAALPGSRLSSTLRHSALSSHLKRLSAVSTH